MLYVVSLIEKRTRDEDVKQQVFASVETAYNCNYHPPTFYLPRNEKKMRTLKMSANFIVIH